MKSMAPLVLLGLFSLTLSSEQKTKSNIYCWGQLSPPNLAKIWLHMYLCDLGTLITESHISFFCRSASRGGFFSGERLKKPKNGRSNDHRHSKKCENDHRIGGQFRVFLKSSPLKNPPPIVFENSPTDTRSNFENELLNNRRELGL